MPSLWHPTERDPLWRREVRERWRRPWTFLLLGLYAAFLAILARVFYGSLVPQGEVSFSRQGLGLGAPMFWRFVMCQIVGWFPLGLLLGAPSIALERERQSLTEYALAGLTSRQIVRAKWLSLASFALVLVVAPLPVASLSFFLGGVSSFDFLAANTLCVGVALASCTMGLAISATHRTVSAAFLDALKKMLGIGFFAAPLLAILPILPPPFLLITGLCLVLVPLAVVPKIEQEIFWVMWRLESDAPQSPDQIAPPGDVSFRLDALKSQFAQGARRGHEPMDEWQAERMVRDLDKPSGPFDPPPSPLDISFENFVAFNPLALRDVRTQFRSWRRQAVASETTPQLLLRLSMLLAFLFVLFGSSGGVNKLWALIYGLWHVGMMLIALHIILLASSSFTRERAGNMLVQLHLSALSPSEILVAKVGAPIVMGARVWGIPLAVVTLLSLGYDPPRVLLKAVLFALLLVFTSLTGALCSLLFRSIVLSMSAALFTLVALFVVLPSIFSPMLFSTPTFLRIGWTEPLSSLFWGMGSTAAMLPLLVILPMILVALWGLCLRAWKKSV